MGDHEDDSRESSPAIERQGSSSSSTSAVSSSDQQQQQQPLPRDWPGVLRKLQSTVTTTSTKERSLIFTQMLVPQLTTQDLPEKAIPFILQLLTLTISRYEDRKSRLLVEKALSALLAKSTDALRVLVFLLADFATDATKKGAEGNFASLDTYRFVIFSWACLAVETSYEKLVVDSEIWSTLVGAQIVLLESLVAAPKTTVARSAVTKFSSLLNKNKDAYQNYLKVVEKSEISHTLAPTIGLIIQHLSVKDKPEFEKRRASFIDYFVKIALSSKTIPPRHVVRSFSKLNSMLTMDEVKQTIIPVVEKTILRSPEVVVVALAGLLEAITFDVSEIAVQTLLKLLSNQIKSTTNDIRTGAVECFKHLAKKCHNLEAVKTLLNELLAVAGGSQGKLPSMENKAGFILAAKAFSHASLSQEDAALLSAEALTKLIPQAEKEAHDQTTEIFLQTISSFLTHASDFTPAYEKFFKAGITSADKPVVRKSHLLCLSEGLPASLFPKFFPLVDSVMESVKKVAAQALAQPALAAEAYAALHLLARLKDDPKIDAHLQTKGFWKDIMVPTSFVFNERVFGKQTAEDSLILLKFLNEASRCLNITPVMGPLCDAVVVVGLNPTWKVKNPTHQIIRKLAQDVPELREPLLAALSAYLSRPLEPTEQLSALVVTMLVSICSYAKDTKQEAIDSTLLAALLPAHHPIANPIPDTRFLWDELAQKSSSFAIQVLERNVDSVVGKILSLPFAKLEGDNRTGVFVMIRNVARISPTIVVPQLFGSLVRTLDLDSLKSLSATDVAVFRTPEGELYENVLEKKEEYKSRKKDSQKNMTDEEWYESVRKEIEVKKAAEQGKKMTKDEEKLFNAQLKKESDIRQKVKAIYTKFSDTFDIIKATIQGNPSSLHAFIPSLLKNLIQPLLAFDLLQEIVSSLVLKLSECLSDKIANSREQLTVALLRILKLPGVPANWLQQPLKDQVASCLAKVQRSVASGPLPPPSFYFCFQLISKVLRDNAFGDQSHLVGLQITHEHCSLGHSVLLPRVDMIKLFKTLLSSGHSKSKLVQQCLTDLSVAMADSATTEEIFEVLDGLLSSATLLRICCLEALHHLVCTQEAATRFATQIWLARFDDEDQVADLAKGLWEDSEISMGPGYAPHLIALLSHEEICVRSAAGRAIKGAMDIHPTTVHDTVTAIIEVFKVKAFIPPQEKDELGRPIKKDIKDESPTRLSMAIAFKEFAPILTSADLPDYVNFLIYTGFPDPKEEVRSKLLEGAQEMITLHGKQNVNQLLPLLEEYLKKPAASSTTADQVRAAVVVLIGSLSQHLEPSDPRVPVIVQRLLDTLKVPSEHVQMSVAECLPPLVKSLKEDSTELVQTMLTRLVDGKSYGERKGAAYGLAAVVKGRGIATLKDCNVIGRLKEIIEEKNANRRQSALFAFETLSVILGRLFEPYVIQVLPLLLAAFGDSSSEVRNSAGEVAKVIMSKISGHAVKLILPSILDGLSDKQWRTKEGSIEILGSMAHLAPKQLSSSLPTIVPKLIEVLVDSHIKVITAGKNALNQIGSVIRNPEIQNIVPHLLDAFVDPNLHTAKALAMLLETAFVHVVDAPSLALIIPVLARGLRERSSETKKMAAQILGNMCSLADPKDLQPYLATLLPAVKDALVDPNPEVRRTASIALGTMVGKIGEDSFDGLVPWLVTMLKSNQSSVDRAGAAQGLSEVLANLGPEKFDAIIPEIITSATSPLSHVRDGFLSLFIYLPTNFGDKFQTYLPKAIPPILAGLADEAETVRATALRAGQMIVTNYAYSSIELLLPQLLSGMFDPNWRIRQCSVQLVGDLLYKITGVTGKTQVDGTEDDALGTDEGVKAVGDVLGLERREIVLSTLYILRSDVNLMVRQSSLHVWKTIVSNTPRTVREILSTMMKTIIDCLASSDFDKRQAGGRTLGDLVRKLGDRVLPEIIPVLEEGLKSERSDTRQGVCVGLSEIMSAAGRSQVNQFLSKIVPAVRKALCDPDPDVREPATEAFNALHKHVGRAAVDEILPPLLRELNSQDTDTAEQALEGLKMITAAKSVIVFPILVEHLLHPISPQNAKALGAIIPFSGEALAKFLPEILGGLMEMSSEARKSQSPEDLMQVRDTVRILLLSVDGEEAVRHLLTDLIDKSQKEEGAVRLEACEYINIFCTESKANFSGYLNTLITSMLARFNEENTSIVSSAWGALDGVMKSIKKEELPQYAIIIRKALRPFIDEGKFHTKELKGFCLPKGISPLIPVFLQGLLNGSAEARETAAYGLGDLVTLTSEEALKPHIINITGPLIRIIGDRFPWQVKAAILNTLALLLDKVKIQLKPFIPQLQSTFVKALNDPTPLVRQKAADALSKLVVIHTKVDPLITELNTGVKAAEGDAKVNYLKALQSVLKVGGTTISEPVLKNVEPTLLGLYADAIDPVRIAAAVAVSSYAQTLKEGELVTFVKASLLLTDKNLPWEQRHGAALATCALIKDAPAILLQNAEISPLLVDYLKVSALDDKAQVSQASVITIRHYLNSDPKVAEEGAPTLVPIIVKVINEKPFDAKKAAIVSLKEVAKRSASTVTPHLKIAIPPLMVAVKEKNVPIKLASERALLYCLELKKGTQVMDEYMKTLQSDPAKNLADYHKRVLSKLASSSEESDEDDDEKQTQ